MALQLTCPLVQYFSHYGKLISKDSSKKTVCRNLKQKPKSRRRTNSPDIEMRTATTSCKSMQRTEDKGLSLHDDFGHSDANSKETGVYECSGSMRWLHSLYELWEPQLSDSYRPSASSPVARDQEEDNDEEVMAKKEMKRKGTKDSLEARLGRLKAVETVVTTVRHLQKISNKQHGGKKSLGRHSSVGIIDHLPKRNLMKRTMSSATY